MKIKKFAPVLIPTLNRYKHLKRCVDSLARNTHAAETILYIALDAPAKEEHKEGRDKIIKYLSRISGFKKVIIIKRPENFGATRNTYESIDDLFKKYDEIIFSEDDNYFSPNFLDYINKGLQLFKNRKDIFAVCGYNFPVEIPADYPYNFCLFKGCPNWGVGWWRSKYKKIDLGVKPVENFLKSFKNILKTMKEANYLLPHLFDVVAKNITAADTVFSMNLVKNNMFCVLPIVSKVRNYGHDGSGAHSGRDNEGVFLDQTIDTARLFDFSAPAAEVVENKKISSGIQNILKTTNMEVLTLGMIFLARNTRLHEYYKGLKNIIVKPRSLL
jgi:glycosyltransferase involved in cell wall biosynthesis